MKASLNLVLAVTAVLNTGALIAEDETVLPAPPSVAVPEVEERPPLPPGEGDFRRPDQPPMSPREFSDRGQERERPRAERGDRRDGPREESAPPRDLRRFEPPRDAEPPRARPEPRPREEGDRSRFEGRDREYRPFADRREFRRGPREEWQRRPLARFEFRGPRAERWDRGYGETARRDYLRPEGPRFAPREGDRRGPDRPDMAPRREDFRDRPPFPPRPPQRDFQGDIRRPYFREFGPEARGPRPELRRERAERWNREPRREFHPDDRRQGPPPPPFQ